MKKFGVYRPRGRVADSWNSPRPTRVKLIEAESAAEAMKLFVAGLPAGGGWDKDTMILKERWRGTSADLWIRRFTPTGLYKGETHFYTHEVTR